MNRQQRRLAERQFKKEQQHAARKPNVIVPKFVALCEKAGMSRREAIGTSKPTFPFDRWSLVVIAVFITVMAIALALIGAITP